MELCAAHRFLHAPALHNSPSLLPLLRHAIKCLSESSLHFMPVDIVEKSTKNDSVYVCSKSPGSPRSLAWCGADKGCRVILKRLGLGEIHGRTPRTTIWYYLGPLESRQGHPVFRSGGISHRARQAQAVQCAGSPVPGRAGRQIAERYARAAVSVSPRAIYPTNTGLTGSVRSL